ncbi:DUF3027 domain-containing protein [Zhihengliuella salsuginis]|uniref:DUF3027 domain-containing protein n=1 Tax=Zhihengliuella salsuginis TaxID=578222 RepID=A0ABQ3GLD3_9MICC|nr:DUF3027 domain-containing protein [Zhihengliuella salsuginis]GHD10557.1 hypothetical protein GCM10008096_24230 [Zhihengliuella salsuginis]
MTRTPKLDAVLAADVAAARGALVPLVPEAQVGAHLGVSAEGDRLVLHRFEARVRGYAGWHWYVTLARGPRVKSATVCDSGLVPGERALLAPAWVPWAERVAPEELAEQKARDEAEAAAAQEPAAEATGSSEAPAVGDDGQEADAAGDEQTPEQDAQDDAAPAGAVDGDEESEGDGQTRPRRRRRPRRRPRSAS